MYTDLVRGHDGFVKGLENQPRPGNECQGWSLWRKGPKKPLWETVKVELSCNGASNMSGRPGPWDIHWGTLLVQREASQREKVKHAVGSRTWKAGLTKPSFEARMILSCSGCGTWSCRVRRLSCKGHPIPKIPWIVGSSFILIVTVEDIVSNPVPWNSTRRAQIPESPVEDTKVGTDVEGTWKSFPLTFRRWHTWRKLHFPWASTMRLFIFRMSFGLRCL